MTAPGQYSPGIQYSAFPLSKQSMPAGQVKQLVEPSGEYSPVAHGVGKAPGVSHFQPAGHFVHEA